MECNKFKNTFVVVCSLILVLLVGCSSDEESGSKGGNGGSNNNELTVALESDIVSLDPAFNYDFSTGLVGNEIAESLLTFDEDGQLQPGIAEDWEAKDEKTFVYYLNENVVFSDGSALTADDVVFSLDYYRDPDVGSYIGWMYDSVEDIKKLDDHTVEVSLKDVDVFWEYVPAAGARVFSKAHFEENEDSFGNPDVGIIGSGPFKYVSWDSGSEIVLEKNENYWNDEGGPYLDKITYQIIPEGTTRVTGLSNGQINLVSELPVDLVDKVKEMDNTAMIESDSYLIDGIEFNTEKEPFNDVKVRQAINYALDNKQLDEQVVKDRGTSAISVVPPALWTFEEDKWEAAYEELPTYDHNLEKAKELMAESSHPDGFEATVLTQAEEQLFENYALALQDAVEPLGIDLNIEKLTGEELMSVTFGGARDYDIVIQNWSADFPDPSGNLNALFNSKNTEEGGANYANYKNDKVDKLLNEEQSITDNSKRAELLLEAQDIVAEESPWINITHRKWLMGATDDTEGWSLTPLWYWQSMMKDVKFKD